MIMKDLKQLLLDNGFVKTVYPTDTKGEVFLSKTFNVADLPLFVAQFNSDEPDENLPETVVLELSECGNILQYCVESKDCDIDYWLTINPNEDSEGTIHILELFGL